MLSPGLFILGIIFYSTKTINWKGISHSPYTNGNMADNVNEKGYDVFPNDNERVSVKTTSRTSGRGHVFFK